MKTNKLALIMSTLISTTYPAQHMKNALQRLQTARTQLGEIGHLVKSQTAQTLHHSGVTPLAESLATDLKGVNFKGMLDDASSVARTGKQNFIQNVRARAQNAQQNLTQVLRNGNMRAQAMKDSFARTAREKMKNAQQIMQQRQRDVSRYQDIIAQGAQQEAYNLSQVTQPARTSLTQMSNDAQAEIVRNFQSFKNTLQELGAALKDRAVQVGDTLKEKVISATQTAVEHVPRFSLHSPARVDIKEVSHLPVEFFPHDPQLSVQLLEGQLLPNKKLADQAQQYRDGYLPNPYEIYSDIQLLEPDTEDMNGDVTPQGGLETLEEFPGAEFSMIENLYNPILDTNDTAYIQVDQKPNFTLKGSPYNTPTTLPQELVVRPNYQLTNIKIDTDDGMSLIERAVKRKKHLHRLQQEKSIAEISSSPYYPYTMPKTIILPTDNPYLLNDETTPILNNTAPSLEISSPSSSMDGNTSTNRTQKHLNLGFNLPARHPLLDTLQTQREPKPEIKIPVSNATPVAATPDFNVWDSFAEVD